MLPGCCPFVWPESFEVCGGKAANAALVVATTATPQTPLAQCFFDIPISFVMFLRCLLAVPCFPKLAQKSNPRRKRRRSVLGARVVPPLGQEGTMAWIESTFIKLAKAAVPKSARLTPS